MSLPKSPEERRKAKAARQARWRERAKQRAQVATAVNASLGVAPGSTDLPDMPKADLAALIREKAIAAIAGMDDETLMSKDVQPFLANALRAEGQIEARQKNQKGASAELAWAILKMLAGGESQPVAALEDGRTIEGTFTEVE